MNYKSIAIGMAFLAGASCIQASGANGIRVIVKYKANTKSVISVQTQLEKSSGVTIHNIQPMAGGAYSLKLNLPSRTFRGGEDPTEAVLKKLRKNPNVIYALKDRVGQFKPVPSPKEQKLEELLSHDVQWDEFKAPAGVMLESAPGRKDGAWAYTTGQSSPPIVVAVLDTGIEPNTSLVANIVKDNKGNIWGWNFAGNNNDLSDETGSYHGTHVSGTIAGYGKVMMGMGENLKILPVKIPDSSGMFYESQVINGIYWAVGGEVPGVPRNPFPAKVLNMSFGVDERPGKEIDHCDEALQEAIHFARKQGAVVIAAAGNDNRWEQYNAPAVCNGVVKVASTGPKGYRSYFSNYGPAVNFAAPGGDLRYGKKGGILSTVKPGGGYQNSGFDFYQGTSMASPHAAGIAGLIFAASDKKLSPKKVEQILYTTTHDFGKTDDENESCLGNKPCGHGILDAENAVKTVSKKYDALLTAPKISKKETVSCSKGLSRIKGESINYQGSTWKRVQDDCTLSFDINHPHITKNRDGKFTAHYGNVVYELDASSYKFCELIGYDGLGCYR